MFNLEEEIYRSLNVDELTRVLKDNPNPTEGLLLAAIRTQYNLIFILTSPPSDSVQLLALELFMDQRKLWTMYRSNKYRSIKTFLDQLKFQPSQALQEAVIDLEPTTIDLLFKYITSPNLSPVVLKAAFALRELVVRESQ